MIFPAPHVALSDAEYKEARSLYAQHVVLCAAPQDLRGRALAMYLPDVLYEVNFVCPSRDRDRCYRVTPLGRRGGAWWMPFGQVRRAVGPFLWCTCGTVIEGLAYKRSLQCPCCKTAHVVP